MYLVVVAAEIDEDKVDLPATCFVFGTLAEKIQHLGRGEAIWACIPGCWIGSMPRLRGFHVANLEACVEGESCRKEARGVEKGSA